MNEKPDNIIRFDSENSAFRGFEIHQWQAELNEVHDHKPHEITGDGWKSYVVDPDKSKHGPFDFTGDAVTAMKKMAEERLLAEARRIAAEVPQKTDSSEG